MSPNMATLTETTQGQPRNERKRRGLICGGVKDLRLRFLEDDAFHAHANPLSPPKEAPRQGSRLARPHDSLSPLSSSLQRWISPSAIYTRRIFDLVRTQAFLLASSAIFCLSLHPQFSSGIGSFRVVLQASAPFASCSAATRSTSRHLLIPPI